MAACFAARGFRVKAVDLSSEKVDSINHGVAPVYEPGLEELIREAGRISAGDREYGRSSVRLRGHFHRRRQPQASRAADSRCSTSCQLAKPSAARWELRKNSILWY